MVRQETRVGKWFIETGRFKAEAEALRQYKAETEAIHETEKQHDEYTKILHSVLSGDCPDRECSRQDPIIEFIFDERFQTAAALEKPASGILDAMDTLLNFGAAWSLLFEPFRVAYLETTDPYRLPVGGWSFFAGTLPLDMLSSFDALMRYLCVRQYRSSLRMCNDLIGVFSLPLELLFTLRFGLNETTCFSLLAFLRLARIYKMGELRTRVIEVDSINPFVFFTSEMLLLIFWTAHFFSSCFFFIAKMERFSDDSWVGRFDPNLEYEGVAMQYFTALYWGMTTITTTGYGDIGANTMVEKIWTILFMLAGFTIQAMVIGNLTMMFIERSNKYLNARVQLDKLNELMKKHKVPTSQRRILCKEFRSMLNQSTSRKHEDDELSLIRNYPNRIISKVLCTLFGPLMKETYLVQGVTAKFQNMLLRNANLKKVAPNTTLIRTGDVARMIPTNSNGEEETEDSDNCLFIVVEGSVVYNINEISVNQNDQNVSRNDCIVQIGSRANIFGEHVLLGVPSPWNVKSTSALQVLVIDQKSALQVINEAEQNDIRLLFENIRDYFVWLKNSIEETENASAAEALDRFASAADDMVHPK